MLSLQCSYLIAHPGTVAAHCAREGCPILVEPIQVDLHHALMLIGLLTIQALVEQALGVLALIGLSVPIRFVVLSALLLIAERADRSHYVVDGCRGLALS